MKNIFLKDTVDESIARLDRLTPATAPEWGKMNASQMLAHLNVAYEMAFENKHKKQNALMRFLLKIFVKSTVCGDKPYKRNSHTAPEFKITDERDFENEKGRLIRYMRNAQEFGQDYFDGKESLSFGKLTWQEWNTLFYKHLNHHFTQFGV